MERRVGRRLIAEAMAYVVFVRLGLSFASYRRIAGFVRVRELKDELRPVDVRRICWAIAYAARSVPKASCLTQALAAQMMLARRGHRATLRVGAARNARHGFRAHAWLLSDGQIMLGGSEEDFGDFGHLLDIEAGVK